MSVKQAAEELLKIADAIENEAQQVTNFVCADCNHTATLATINERRKTAAEEVEEKVVVADITVNDEVGCPACGGTMSYQASEESSKYYIDTKKAGDDEDDEDEKEEEMEEKSASDEPVDYDSIQRYSSED